MIKGGRTYPANANPKFSILNPEYTYSVPKYQMVSGIFDTMSHLMEQYFTGLSKAQDWEVHMIEHQLGAYTDCAHGVGLAIISVPYYKYIYQYGIDKFVRFAKKSGM